MGKITEQLSKILQTPKNSLVETVTKLLQSNNTPPANVNLMYVNGKLYVNNNFNLFNLADDQKTELMSCMLTDALNNLKQPESQNKAELSQAVECGGCSCDSNENCNGENCNDIGCNNAEIWGMEN